MQKTPEPGDVYWTQMGPVAGTEQDGFRPVLVLSPTKHNAITGRVSCVTITSRIRSLDSEVPIYGLPKPCVAQIDQVTTIDWKARGAKFRGETVSDEEMEGVRKGLIRFLSLDQT